MSVKIPIPGPRPKQNSGKVAFRHCFAADPELKHAFYTELPEGLQFDAAIIDFLVVLRGARQINEAGEAITGAELVKNISAAIHNCLSKAKCAVMYTDKSAPMAKAPTQRKRIDDETIPPEVKCAGAQATPEEYRLIERRQNKINKVVRTREQRKITLARDKIISKDDTIPQPFNEFTGSKYRPDVMRFIVSSMIGDPQLAFFAPEKKSLIIDGHWMLPSDYPQTVVSELGFHVKTHDELTRHERMKYRNTPLGVYEPRMTEEQKFQQKNFAAEDVVMTRREDSLPELMAEIDFTNNMGEFDAAFGLYIAWMVVKRKMLRFVLYSSDSDILINSLWFLYKLRNMPHTFCLEYFDVEYEATLSDEERKELEKEREGKNKQHRETLTKYADAVDIWISYESGYNASACVSVNQLYDAIVAKAHMIVEESNGREVCMPCDDVIPNILTAIMACDSDFTLGYYGTTMYTFITAFYLNLHHIGRLVTFTEDGRGVILNKAAYYRLVKCVYITQYRSKFLPKPKPKKRKRKDADTEPDLEVESEPEVFCTDFKLHAVRTLLNEKVVATKYHKYMRDESLLAEMDAITFKRFHENVKNMVPPNNQINHRAALVAALCIFVHGYGNAVLRFPDPLKFGFKKIDKSRPLCGANLDFKATHNWAHWDEKWSMAKLARHDPLAKRVLDGGLDGEESNDGLMEADWDE